MIWFAIWFYLLFGIGLAIGAAIEAEEKEGEKLSWILFGAIVFCWPLILGVHIGERAGDR